MSESYETSKLNRVVRNAERGKYDYETVHSIIRAAPYVHLAFVGDDGLPQCVPLICVLDESDEGVFVILHGYHSARFLRLTSESGIPLCVTATLADAVILSLAAFHHSNNYRSATLHGFTEPLDQNDLEMKRRYSKDIVESVCKGRWDHCRQPTDAELRSTGFLRMRVETGSAKVKHTGTKEDKTDLADTDLLKRVWTGVLPLTLSFQKPEPAPFNKAPFGPYLKDYVKNPL